MLKVKLTFISFALFFIFQNSTAQEINSFSKDSALFYDEMREFFSTVNNTYKKDVKRLLDEFEGEWIYGGFNQELRDTICYTSNLLLKNRMKPYPHFYQYLSTSLHLIKYDNDVNTFHTYNSSLPAFFETAQQKRVLPKYLENIYNVFVNSVLFKERGIEWKFSKGKYKFHVDSIPYFVFNSIDMVCYAYRNDSINISRTNGILYPVTNIWKGFDGVVNWERAGYLAEDVFANLYNYSINLKKPMYDVDTVEFYNKNFFNRPLLGKFEDKVQSNTDAANARYPRFSSFEKRIQIKNVFDKMEIDAGFSIEGSKILASGDKYKRAQIFFKNEDNDDFLVLTSERFAIHQDRVVSKSSDVTIYFESDSIYHPDVLMKYFDETKILSLTRTDIGLSESPFHNTYHNLDMFFEALNWNTNQKTMNFEIAKGLKTDGQATFESTDYYSEYRFDRIKGIDQNHPLVIIKNFVGNNPSRIFYVEELVDYMHLPETQVKAMLINLANQGFLNYDISNDRIYVKDKLYKYIGAKSGKIDYDVILFNSSVDGESNAILDLDSFNLVIKGVPYISLSDSQAVKIFPANNQIIMKEDRDFIFSGLVQAGKLNFYARDCSFEYDTFRLNMPNIEYLSFSVKAHEKNHEGVYNDVTVKSVIRDLNGTLWIDKPDNKSSLKKHPLYPYFISNENSFVYYNDSSIENGVYNKETFYYEVYPFRFDSLNTFTTDNLEFQGQLVSGGILPTIEQPLKVQDDYSLGIDKTTPDEGYPIYGGAGTFYADLNLSNKGLTGQGFLSYLNSTTESNSFIFYPDSALALAQHFTLDEILTGNECPSVSGDSITYFWRPYQDSLMVQSNPPQSFEMYDNIASFDGSLVLTPELLTGDGKVSVSDAELTSDNFFFHHHIFDSEITSLQLKTADSTAIALSTNVYKSHVDLQNRTGEFSSMGNTAEVELPIAQYICYMDEFHWSMDEAKVNMSNNLQTNNEKLNSLNYYELIDKDLSGSAFISTDPKQDSLTFFSFEANYDLKENILNAEDVKLIRVADAAIFPTDSKLSILRDGKIQALENATIIADTLNKFHYLYDAIVKISSRQKYNAKGYYDYVDKLNETQKIYFEEIKVDTAFKTYAKASISDSTVLALSPHFDFQGSITLYSENPHLNYLGGFRIDQDCLDPGPHWVRFEGHIDPDNIVIPVAENPIDIEGKKITSGPLLSLGQEVYSSFFTPKNRYSDVDLINANGYVLYDDDTEEFRIGSKEVLNNTSLRGNYLSLSNKNCLLYGEGEINTGVDLVEVKMTTYGNASYFSIADSTTLDLVMGFDFYFSDELLDFIQDDLKLADLKGVSITDPKYRKALINMVGEEDMDRILSDLSLYAQIRRFPDELIHTLFFSDVKLKWNPSTRSYVSTAPIGVGSVKDRQINKYVNGYIELAKRRGGDVMNIYLELSNKLWYYFNFTNHVMQVLSSDDEFNTALREMKDKHRKIKLEETKATYQFIISTMRKKIDFVRKMEALDL